MTVYDRPTYDNRYVVIKWFDIFFQELTPLQIIFVPHQKMNIGQLSKYVQNKFIATTSKQKEWHKTLKMNFQKMNQIDANEEKLIIFREWNQFSACTNPISTVLSHAVYVVQLNPKHQAFRKRRFPSIQEMSDLLKEQS